MFITAEINGTPNDKNSAYASVVYKSVIYLKG